MTSKGIGLDFGTTNSAIAVAYADGTLRLARFTESDRLTDTFRSILYFFHPQDPESDSRYAAAGPEAIGAYLSAEPRGRLIQSAKSFLASRSFKQTAIYRSLYTLEDLIAIIAAELRSAAQDQFGEIPSTVVAGRPVRFSGARTEADDEFAIERLQTALRQAGFEEIVFEFEPVAAAYRYEQQLDHDELVLIADFGGGTSDFSLLRLGPAFRTPTSGERTRGTRARGTREILGTDGVAIAGNDFDSVLVRHLVAPKLGFGTEYRSLGKLLPVPRWIYKEFERWHYLSFLKTRQTMEMLESIKTEALEPEKIEQLIHVIDEELGFQLYRAIERTKVELSARQSSTFVFKDWRVEITEEVTRSQFEALISSYLMEMTDCIDRLLGNCNAAPAEVDSVFMTGGSSFVPAVRLLFAEKFGADKLRGGGELTSVAEGLALRALSLNKQAL
jgi:hypothetical chaperone protein